MNTSSQKPIRIAVVVIPTYNEMGNIVALIDAICGVTRNIGNGWSLKILIVDGHSTDNTAECVRSKMEELSHLHLLVEEKKGGIGAAYLEGFTHAIKELHADVVFEFDGDFQHPPEMIPVMLQKIDQGYDYIIGSRFVSGGADLRRGSMVRRILSSAGGYLARLILFFPGKYFRLVTDPTSGLRVTRVSGFLDKMDLSIDHLYSRKFGYKIQLLSETTRLNPRYGEVALLFQDRHAGHSKIEPGTAWEILLTALKSRMHLVHIS